MIDVFLNEAYIYAAATVFKRLGHMPTLENALKNIEDLDEFIQAALYEVISFVVRREIQVAKEGLSKLDGPFIDLRHEGDLALLFDNS